MRLYIITWLFTVASGIFSFKSICSHQSRVHGMSLQMVGKPVTITFQPSGKQILAEQGAILADVAAKAGVFIPFKCKAGRCNSCELRLNGRVSAKACQKAQVPGGPTKKLEVVVVNKAPL